jgi:SNF2 family DNA or RNA helicase
MRVGYEINQNQLWFIENGTTRKATAKESYSYLTTLEDSPIKVIETLCPIILNLDVEKESGKTILSAKVSSRNASVSIASIEDSLEYVCTNEIWLPIEKNSLTDILQLFKDAEIDNLGILNYSQELYVSIQGKRLTPALEIKSLPKREIAEVNGVPKLINATPYPYQIDGFHWLTWLGSAGVGGILGDEMGLGKTMQIIMLLAHEISGKRTPNLIVCPPSLMENWRREIERFIGLKAVVHHGSQRIFNRDELESIEILITSYDAVRRDELILGQIEWNLIALDEAQYIKNESSQRHTAVKKLKKQFGVAVSGTPIENHLSDLWSLADFVIPGVLGSSEWFMSNFGDDEESAEALREIVSPIILRRRVSEVAKDLPPVTLKPVALELVGELAFEYSEEVKTWKNEKRALFSLISKLRQICCHVLEINQSSVIESTSGKFEYLSDTLEELFANKNKAIIFAPFTTTISDIEKWFREKFPHNQVHTLFGETPIPERQTMVDRFTADLNPGVLIMNPKAGGVGLNITTANHVIHFAPDWNPAVMDQASARSFRRGQVLPVTIHNLFYVDSVEEYMYEKLNAKRSLSEAALSDTDVMPTVEELMKALERVPHV